MPDNLLTKRYFGGKVAGWAVLAGVAGVGMVWFVWRRRTPAATGDTSTTGAGDTSANGNGLAPISGGSGTACPPGTYLDPETGGCVGTGGITGGCPSGTMPDASGGCQPIGGTATCPPGYVPDPNGICYQPGPGGNGNGNGNGKKCPPGFHVGPLGACQKDRAGKNPCHAGYEYDPTTDQCHPVHKTKDAPAKQNRPATVTPKTASTSPGHSVVTVATLGKAGKQGGTDRTYVKDPSGDWVPKTPAVVKARRLAGLGEKKKG